MELSLESKRRLFTGGLALLFLVLIGRFAYVQLFRGEQFLEEANKNRVRVIEVDPPRGLIRDRFGEVLVENSPAYAIYAVPIEIRNAPQAYEIISAALRTTPAELKQQIDRNKRGNFVPVKIGRQVDFAAFSLLNERRLELTGVDFRAESRRTYDHGVKAPHLFGYLSEISDAELSLYGDNYSPGDLIGKKGIERQYEGVMRGVKGHRFIEVDALGRVIRDLTEQDGERFRNNPPEPGKDVLLGLDASLQRMLETELTGKNGGAVVLNCKNGDVLALVSKPDFDPELFSRTLTPEIWNRLLNDPNKPLYDRMVQSVYPPGSTFKMITAIAGLETGLINPNETVFCPGYYVFGGRTFECHKKGGHGTVNLLGALEQSCNVYFYRMGFRVGLEHWSDYAERFGFGRATGIDLDEENAGLLPNVAYLDRRYGKDRWGKGMMLNLAIGQGDLLVTPLQMAAFAMALANEGHSFKPRLRRSVLDPFTGAEEAVEPDSMQVKGIRPETWALVRRGMFLVVNGSRGTAVRSRVEGLVSAGKTGTAQNPHGEPHGWFIGFAPFEDPQIAFCVFIENGGSGSGAAAPIARKILSFLVENNKLTPQTEAEEAAD